MIDTATWIPQRHPNLVNAWGTPTPYGVSRSSEAVVAAVGRALRRHVDMQVLQAAAEKVVCDVSGAEAACFSHCAASGLVLASAAAITGTDAGAAATLPQGGAGALLVLNEEHAVDFGQPIAQTLRLSGADVHLLRGSADDRMRQLQGLLASGRLKAMVHVASQLVQDAPPLDRARADDAVRAAGALVIVDAAAQDWRLGDPGFIRAGDLTVFSGQKYLAAPTCGIVVGRSAAVAACRANFAGIGRPMKPTKEALEGLIAAIEERDWGGLDALRSVNVARASNFAHALQQLTGWTTRVLASDQQGPFPRIVAQLADAPAAQRAVDQLKSLPEPIIVGRGGVARGQLAMELTYVDLLEQSYLLRELGRLAVDSAMPQQS